MVYEGEFDVEVDVLVVGAGGCGLVAALAAAGAGAEVAVVEKLERLSGNTMLSSGSIPAAGTRFQREAGIEDDPARFAADLRRTAGIHEADDLVDTLTQNAAPMIEWLADTVGLNIELIRTYKHVGHSVNRLHALPGRRGTELMGGLWQAVEAAGIPVAFASPVVSLLTDANKRVIGAETRSDDGEITRIGAKATILATNGYGNNRELLRRHAPEIAEATYFGALGSDGEAIVWGEALGAAIGNMGAYQAHAGIAQPHGALLTWTVIEKGGVILDDSGNRIASETLGYSGFAGEVLRQQRPVFAVYDRRVRDATAAGQPEFAELVTHGGAPEYADLQAVADFIGAPVEAVAASLAEAGAAADGAADDRFGRTAWGLGALEAPYVVTRIAPALFHTQGGLLVDARARVRTVEGSTVCGLYAGGGAAAGVSGKAGSNGYASGNGLLGAMTLGFIAGRAAAEEAKASAN